MGNGLVIILFQSIMSNRKKKNLSHLQLRWLIQELLLRSSVKDGMRKPDRGAMKWAANEFNITPRHVSRLWKEACKSFQEKGLYSASPKKKGNSGRPTKLAKVGTPRYLKVRAPGERSKIPSRIINKKCHLHFRHCSLAL